MRFRNIITFSLAAFLIQSCSQKTIPERTPANPIKIENLSSFVKVTDETKNDRATIKVPETAARNYSGVSKDTLRTKIVNTALSLTGVAYRYGQSSETGFDCSGYVKYVYRSIGLDLPHSSFAMYQMSRHIKADEALPGDMVFFVTRGTGISHVGIYLGDDCFIHSPGKGDSVSVDTLNGGYYKTHLAGFGTLLQK